jgi:hypothetical protein
VPSDPVTTTPPALDSSAPIDPRLVPPTFDGDQSSESELDLSTAPTSYDAAGYHSSESELNLSTAPTSYNAALYHSSESELDISIAPTSIDAVEPDTLGGRPMPMILMTTNHHAQRRYFLKSRQRLQRPV